MSQTEKIELAISRRTSKEGKPYLVLSNVVGQYAYPVTFDREVIRKLFGFSEMDMVRLLATLTDSSHIAFYVERAD